MSMTAAAGDRSIGTFQKVNGFSVLAYLADNIGPNSNKF